MTRGWVLRVMAFLLIFIGLNSVGVLAHEAGHLLVNNLLGGTGEIFYDDFLTSGHMEWVTPPSKHIWLVWVGGGVFASAFLFVFFWLPPKLTHTKQDVYLEAAVTSPILGNLIYGVTTDFLLYLGKIKIAEAANVIAQMAAGLLFSYLYAMIVAKWIVGKNGTNGN